MEGLQPTFCTVSTAPDLTLSKIAYTRFYGVLNDMVKAVYVHAPDKSKGHREQQIDISYDLVGILPASLLNDLQNGETA